MALNVAVFLWWPARADVVFGHVGRSARVIREHDAQVARVVETIRGAHSPETTVVCHLGQHLLLGLRVFQIHLPEFDQYELRRDPVLSPAADRPLMRSRAGRVEFVSELDLAGKTTLLLIVPPGGEVGRFGERLDVTGARLVDGSEGLVYEVKVSSF